MVDSTWRVQFNSGTSTVTSSLTVSLPNATQPGSTLFLMIATGGSGSVNAPGSLSFDPPWVADLANLPTYWWRRGDQPGGETSWAIATAPASATYAWHVQEWSGLSTVGNPDARSTVSGSVSFAVIIGSQTNDVNSGGNVGPTPDVTDYAALLVAHAQGATDGVWPAGHTWGTGWSEIDSVQSGDGSHTGDIRLLIAEAYPGTSGSALSGALTWDATGGGSYTGKTVRIGAGCYQPAPALPPTGILTS